MRKFFDTVFLILYYEFFLGLYSNEFNKCDIYIYTEPNMVYGSVIDME